MNKTENNKKGFTLLELLVVVLIIGILAGIALPQYQRAKEKTIMTEGMQLAKQILEANIRYYLINGDYTNDIRNLDIEFSGEIKKRNSIYRVDTNNFVISSGGSEPKEIVVIQRVPYGERYFIYIHSNKPNSIKCGYYTKATKIQQELCSKLNKDGHL